MMGKCKKRGKKQHRIRSQTKTRERSFAQDKADVYHEKTQKEEARLNYNKARNKRIQEQLDQIAYTIGRITRIFCIILFCILLFSIMATIIYSVILQCFGESAFASTVLTASQVFTGIASLVVGIYGLYLTIEFNRKATRSIPQSINIFYSSADTRAEGLIVNDEDYN